MSLEQCSLDTGCIKATTVVVEDVGGCETKTRIPSDIGMSDIIADTLPVPNDKSEATGGKVVDARTFPVPDTDNVSIMLCVWFLLSHYSTLSLGFFAILVVLLILVFLWRHKFRTCMITGAVSEGVHVQPLPGVEDTHRYRRWYDLTDCIKNIRLLVTTWSKLTGYADMHTPVGVT